MVDTGLSSGVSSEDNCGVTAEEKIRALRAILDSDTFARSERLKSLLRFVCEAEIEGRGSELNEYTIGTAALGRPKDFAPLEDSSVRSRAHELRHKLEKYYSQEAPFAAVRVGLRKGSYVPRFFAVHATEEKSALIAADVAESAVPLAPAPTVKADPPRQEFRRFARLLVMAFAAGSAAMFVLLASWSAIANPGSRVPGTRIQTAAMPSSWTPELEALWKPFIQKDTPLLMAFEIRFFVDMGPLVVRDWHVNNISGVENSEPLMQLQKLFGVHQLYASGNYTDLGVPGALFYLTRALAPRVPLLSVRSSGELNATDLRDSNIILLGKPWGEAHVERVLAAADLVDMNGRIVNRHPGPGERAEYKDQRENRVDLDSWTEKYSVISVMPGPTGRGRLMALTASGSEHPSALAYYLTQPDTVRDLVQRLKASTGKIPDYFQVLVRAEFKSKALVKVEYVTHRPLNGN